MDMHHAHDAYLESRILTADPVELIRVLYQTCIGEVREARRELREGNIAERARHISKACAVLMELAGSLDYERGGEISLHLLRLYDYMQRRLTEANFRKLDEPMAEILGLLTTLAEAWDGVKAQTQPEQPVANAWMPAMPEPDAAYTSNAWSL